MYLNTDIEIKKPKVDGEFPLGLVILGSEMESHRCD